MLRAVATTPTNPVRSEHGEAESKSRPPDPALLRLRCQAPTLPSTPGLWPYASFDSGPVALRFLRLRACGPTLPSTPGLWPYASFDSGPVALRSGRTESVPVLRTVATTPNNPVRSERSEAESKSWPPDPALLRLRCHATTLPSTPGLWPYAQDERNQFRCFAPWPLRPIIPFALSVAKRSRRAGLLTGVLGFRRQAPPHRQTPPFALSVAKRNRRAGLLTRLFFDSGPVALRFLRLRACGPTLRTNGINGRPQACPRPRHVRDRMARAQVRALPATSIPAHSCHSPAGSGIKPSPPSFLHPLVFTFQVQGTDRSNPARRHRDKFHFAP